VWGGFYDAPVQRVQRRADSPSTPVYAALAMATHAPAERLTSFEAPNAGTGAYQGTFPNGINSSGAIVGTVTDSNNANRGFVRAPDGKFTEFDIPGSAGLSANSINESGTVAGTYVDSSYAAHGFVRTPDGKVVTFDAPGDTGGTYALNINYFGVVQGYYYDSNTIVHGFLRMPDGKNSTFSDPEAGSSSPYMGTWAVSLNDFGAVAGSSTDSSYGSHGFVRSPNGSFTTFNYPGNVESPSSNGLVNAFGAVAGSFDPVANHVAAGYQRTPDGRITVYEAPGAGAAQYEGTYINAFNAEGSVTGCLDDTNNVQHSFVRDAKGHISEFDIPGQLLTPGSGGSCGEAISVSGVVMGYWLDADDVFHGFIRYPED